MIKGCVFFDYDGTLVDEREQIYEPTLKTKQGIQALQKNGYVCLLATGRALSYIPQGAIDLHLDGYVTCNGANVEVEDKTIYNKVLDKELVVDTLKQLEEEDANYILEGNTACYVKDIEEAEFQHFMKYFKVPWTNYAVLEDLEKVLQDTLKITVICQSKEQMDRISNTLHNDYVCSFHRNCITFDISAKRINKSNGIRVLMDHYQLPRAAMYAFGDGDNDIEMLSFAGCGIAMTPYHPALEAVADRITSSVKEEGIYKALIELHLI